MVLLFSTLSAPGYVSVIQDPVNDALTSGTINGIQYSYGLNTYSASGNASITNNGTIQEFRNDTQVTTESIDLLVSANVTDAWYLFDQISETVENTTSQERWYNSTTLIDWVIFVNNTVATINDANVTRGRELLSLNSTEAYSLREAVMVDQNEDYLGTTMVNTTYYEYNHRIGASEFKRVSGVFFPRVIILDVVRETHQLDVTRQKVSQSYMSYYQEFARAYNITASAYQVNITDGENLGLSVSMFDSIEANYTEYIISVISYAFFFFDVTTLTFDNGTDVGWQYYPKDMLPKVFTTSGTQVEAGYIQVQSKILSTFQSVTAAFASVNATASDAQVSVEAQFALWNVQMGTNLVAYDDGNGDGRLNLSLDRDGLQIASDDRVSHIGLTEAYETTVFSARYNSHIYNESVQLLGLGINETRTNINETSLDFAWDQWSFGNVNAAVNPVFTWNDPVEQADGTVVFDFGISYSSFPVTWVSTFDGTTFEDNENIAYSYMVYVNPSTGTMRVSPTWTYGGIENAELRARMNGKSLGTLIKSEFFALRAVYTATASNETLNSTSTSTFGKLAVNVGGGEATEIDVTGPKSMYSSGSTTYGANFDAINLVQVAGHFSGERASPFESESEDTAGTATKSIVETLEVSFFYSASLIVVSYPTWSGQNIIHDPDYNVNYQPVKIDDEPIDETSDPTTSDPAIDPPGETPPEVGGIPGFSGIVGLLSLVTAVMILRTRRR